MVSLLLNPFARIAGGRALAWGVAGIVLNTAVCYLGGLHYHGLLHFGPAPNPAWWCFTIEHLTVWLIPVLLFWIAGMIFSRSHVRLLDLLGTVAFAQLPMIVMSLCLLPASEEMSADLAAITATDLVWALISLPFLVWSLVWLFQAFKVSCNLRGAKLGILYTVIIIGGDMLCRWLIALTY